METKAMTRTQLAEFVGAQIKDFIGKEMADLIQKNITESVAPLQRQVTDWGSRILGASQQNATPTVKREQGTAMSRCVRAIAAARKFGYSDAIEVLNMWGYKDIAE